MLVHGAYSTQTVTLHYTVWNAPVEMDANTVRM